MTDFEDSNYSFGSFDRSDSLGVGEVLNCLQSGNEAYFYQLLITLKDQSSEVSSKCSPDERREIFIGLLKAAVHLRSPDGSALVRHISTTIENQVLKHFDSSGYLEDLSKAKQELIEGLEVEDKLCEDREAESPKIAKLSGHPLSAREFLVFSIAHLAIAGKNEDARSISSQLIPSMREEDKFAVFGSSYICDAVTTFQEPWMLARVARSSLARTLPDRIAYDIKRNAPKILNGELDRTLVTTHRAFYARFIDRMLGLKNNYVRAAISWDEAVKDISRRSKHIEASTAEGFIDYVSNKGAEKHVIQPALARVCQDFHSRPVGRTAFETLKGLNDYSESQARMIMRLDWPSIYAHAQLDYSFDS